MEAHAIIDNIITGTEILNNFPMLKVIQSATGRVRATKLNESHWFSRRTLAEDQKQLQTLFRKRGCPGSRPQLADHNLRDRFSVFPFSSFF